MGSRDVICQRKFCLHDLQQKRGVSLRLRCSRPYIALFIKGSPAFEGLAVDVEVSSDGATSSPATVLEISPFARFRMFPLPRAKHISSGFREKAPCSTFPLPREGTNIAALRSSGVSSLLCTSPFRESRGRLHEPLLTSRQRHLLVVLSCRTLTCNRPYRTEFKVGHRPLAVARNFVRRLCPRGKQPAPAAGTTRQG